MPEGARVDEIEVIRAFKSALFKFQEAATVALGDAEAEMQRMQVALETELQTFWQGQIRKRQEVVTRCLEAVRMKKVFKDATGRQQSAIEEEKALQQAKRKLEEAQAKFTATKSWARKLQKEVELYKGSVQRFATSVQSDIPAAAAHLEALGLKLDAYIAAQLAAGYSGAPAAGTTGPQEPSMARGTMATPAGSSQETAQLRQQVPSPQERASAPLMHQLTLAAGNITDDQRQAVAGLVGDQQAPGEGKVYVAASAIAAPRIVLHRTEPSSPDDTGWSLAAATAGAGADWSAIPIAEFFQFRPDLRDLTALASGFSVIIDTSGIEAVLDPQQQTVWHRAS